MDGEFVCREKIYGRESWVVLAGLDFGLDQDRKEMIRDA